MGWEKILSPALLALRTVTYNATGFGPVELVHDLNLRTPEVLLYEHWVQSQEIDAAVTNSNLY